MRYEMNEMKGKNEKSKMEWMKMSEKDETNAMSE